MRKGYPRGHQRRVGEKIAYRLVLNRTDKSDAVLVDCLEPLRSQGMVTATIKEALHAYVEAQQKYDVLVAQVNRLMALVESGELAIGRPVQQPSSVHLNGSIELSAPVYEDEDVIVIKRDKNAEQDVTNNFLTAFNAIGNISSAEASEQTRPMVMNNEE